MFARFFLTALSIISLIWIVFIGYDLLDRSNSISPETVFSKNDGEILIVNRSSEVLLDELDCKINPEIESVFSRLLKNVYPNERLFASENRPVLLIETGKIWTKNGVRNYFRTKGIKINFSSDNLFSIENKFQGAFKKNYIVVSNSAINVLKSRNNPETVWPLWDNKASASIVLLSNPLKSTNIYFKENGTVSYQTKYGPVLKTNKIDDEDLFSQFIPAEVEEYHFVEKNFAISNGLLDRKSKLNQWLEDAYVEFKYNNSACIISDFNKLDDPISILGSENADNDLSSKFTGIRLTKSFPKNLKTGFHIGRVADKVVVSESKNVLEKIIADYQLGNTLALNPEKSKAIFYKMPKKVSERFNSNGKTISLSSFKNLLIKTELDNNDNAANVSQVTEVNSELKVENNSFALSGQITSLLGNSLTVFCVSSENELLAISNKKLLWRQKLEGKVVSQAKLIDLNDNGKQQILINTSEKVYLFDNMGRNVNEFPLNTTCSNAVSFYRWSNKTNFLVVNSANELLQIDQNGRIIKKAKISVSLNTNEVDVFKNGKTITALLSSDSKSIYFDLEKNRETKKSSILPSNRVQLKTLNGFFYFETTNQGLFKFDQNGIKSNVYKGSNVKNLKKIYKGKEILICFQDKNKIIILNENGTLAQKINTSISEIENFDILTSRNGQTYFAAIDGIENNIYLFNSKGEKLNSKAFEGKGNVKLSEENGKITITTSIQNYLVQYYNVVKF